MVSGRPSTLRFVIELPDGTVKEEVKIHGPIGYTDGIICTEFNLGYPVVRELIQLRPGIHGSIDDSYLHGAREFTCELKLLNTGTTRYQKLEQIKRMFMVANRPVLYVWSEGWASERRMVLRGNPVTCQINHQSHVRLVVNISANVPSGILEAGSVVTYTVYPGGTQEGREYPRTPSWYYEPGFSSQVAYIENNGDIKSPPGFRIFGPVTSPIIRNATVDKQLSFPGLVIADGDHVIIDTETRTVQSSSGASLYRYLDPDVSTWWDVEVGENIISFYGEDTTANTRLEIFYTERYL